MFQYKCKIKLYVKHWAFTNVKQPVGIRETGFTLYILHG